MIIFELVVIAAVYVSFSVFAQRKLSNYSRIKELKKEMDAKMKELKEMGTNTPKEAMAAKQKEIMSLSTESMRHQMKSTFIILPVFFVLFYVALPMAFPAQPNVTALGMTVSYKTFFVAVAFTLGILSTIAISIYEKVASRQKTVPAQ